MTRKLLNKRKVKEFANTVQLTIDTKCPDKWLFADLQTGDIWQTEKVVDDCPGLQQLSVTWKKATKDKLKCLQNIVNKSDTSSYL
jgi:hypothetical protein